MTWSTNLPLISFKLLFKLCFVERKGKVGFGQYKVQERTKLRKCNIISYYTESGNEDVNFAAVPSVLLGQCVIKYPIIFMKTYFCIYISHDNFLFTDFTLPRITICSAIFHFSPHTLLLQNGFRYLFVSICSQYLHISVSFHVMFIVLVLYLHV